MKHTLIDVLSDEYVLDEALFCGVFRMKEPHETPVTCFLCRDAIGNLRLELTCEIREHTMTLCEVTVCSACRADMVNAQRPTSGCNWFKLTARGGNTIFGDGPPSVPHADVNPSGHGPMGGLLQERAFKAPRACGKSMTIAEAERTATDTHVNMTMMSAAFRALRAKDIRRRQQER